MFAVRCQLTNAGKALAFVENALILFSTPDVWHCDHSKTYRKRPEGLDRGYSDPSGCYCLDVVLYEGTKTLV
jgi:hypothetical protein